MGCGGAVTIGKSAEKVSSEVAGRPSLVRFTVIPADGGDYTVHVVVGLDAEGRMYLLDLWRKRAAADEWVEAFCDLVLA